MKALFLNLLLALTWCAASGAVNTQNFALGFLVGFTILSVQTEISRGGKYRKKVWYVFVFALYFLREVLVGALQVAWAVIWPFRAIRPGIVALPLSARTTIQQTLLANAMTLTPGTMSVELSADGKTLYVHVMDMENADEVRRKFKSGLEAHLLRMLS
ncbi:MAG: Na+/H+ antiporter subunit E [Candidatus Hydrogenedentes bacterium]|nr:Na+/H+ antiporter subunit E [Candidatus Hydrogenedentota bacterium]